MTNFDLRYYKCALRHMRAWTICQVFSDPVTYVAVTGREYTMYIIPFVFFFLTGLVKLDLLLVHFVISGPNLIHLYQIDRSY